MKFWESLFGKLVKSGPADDYFEDQWFFKPINKSIGLIVSGQLDCPTL